MAADCMMDPGSKSTADSSVAIVLLAATATGAFSEFISISCVTLDCWGGTAVATAARAPAADDEAANTQHQQLSGAAQHRVCEVLRGRGLASLLWGQRQIASRRR